MEYTIKTTYTLDAEMFADVIDTALESGIGYWAHTGKWNADEETLALTWNGEDFADGNPYASGEIVVTYSDITDAIESLHNRTAQAGNWIMEQLDQWLVGQPTMDADLADVIIQIATFGELIYG